GGADREHQGGRPPGGAAGRPARPGRRPAAGHGGQGIGARVPEDRAIREEAPVELAPATSTSELREEMSGEMPRVRLTRARILASVLFVLSSLAFLYFVLPKILGLRETWNRLGHGDVWWLVLAAFLEVLSFAC